MRKLIFVFAVLFVLMQIGLCSATLSFSNYAEKIDDGSRYGKIDVWDGNIIFPDEKFATHKLEYNTDVCFIDCQFTKTITLYKEGKLIDDIYFTDGKTRDVSLTLVNGKSYEIDVPDYKEECNDIEVDNKTTGKLENVRTCENKEIGTHKETRYEDVPYKGDVLPAGTYTLVGKAKKLPTESIDWVVVSNGVALTQEAWWNGAWTKKKEIKIQELTGNSWTNYSVNMSVTYDSDMNADFSDIRFTDGTETFTLPYWIESSTASTKAAIWVKTPLTANINTSIYMYYGNSLSGATTSNASSAFLFDDNASVDRTNEYAVIGGTPQTWSWSGGEYTYRSNTGVGNGIMTAKGLNESNVMLTAQIRDVATYYTAGVVIRAGNEGKVYKIQKVNANIKAREDDTDLATIGTANNNAYFNVTLWAYGSTINWSGQGATYGSYQATDTTYTTGYAGLFDYSDGSMQFNKVRIRQFGTTEPTTTFGAEEAGGIGTLTATQSYPVNYYNSSSQTINLGCNFSTSIATTNITSVNITIINSTGALAYGNTIGSLNSLSENRTWTTTTLPEGVYNWSCSARNSVYGINATSTNRTFTIHTTPPTLSIITPISSVYNYRNVSFNYTVADAFLGSCWYSLNGNANITISGCANTTVYLNPRNNTLILYANDTLGNTNSTKVYPYYFPDLGLCNASNTLAFINITFKNETTLQEAVTASISSSTWTYSFDPGISKVFTYSNTTAENPSYSFCIDGGASTLNTSVTMQYYNAYSPSRTYNPGTLSLTNVTTNISLLLLPTNLGLYVTFQVVDLTSAPISSASINASTSGILIESKLTDGAGAATFFLNPLNEYTICAGKSGYSTICSAIVPTQTQYTLTLSPTSTASNDYTRGISYSTQPFNYELGNGTNYLLNFTLNSTFWTITSWGYNIYDQNGNNVASATSAGNGGYLGSTLNTGSNQSFTMNSFWVINNTYFNVSKTWIIINTADNQYSILHFFQDFNKYTNASSTGLFGLQNSPNNNFSFSLIIFLIIFTSAGVLSYKYGLTSPAAIMVVIFGLVYFFDVVVNVLPRLPTAPNIPSATIITLIILTALVIKEAQR